jgi:hypothetical protein
MAFIIFSLKKVVFIYVSFFAEKESSIKKLDCISMKIVNNKNYNEPGNKNQYIPLFIYVLT